ncbi:hypothetical protein BK660_01810 [Pseudomonas brassicacearum]|uniref:Cthe-2314-like HEPN domain-containing protein n=1 Tax=Pseudomonas brassicacearum TaxID=930166 RepID=A0A423IG65_9PSED|nr:hypothetical protein [Pseudomonas brassicacearum]RON24432.1 hypothetical protein BK660_01810 [Pseudomonas brassicacearum]
MSDKFYDVDFDFPGLEIQVEIEILREYLKQMPKILLSAQTGYIESVLETGSIEDHDFSVEYVAEQGFARYITQPLILTVFALFEGSMIHLIRYAQKAEGKKIELSDMRHGGIPTGMNTYLQHVLGLEFQISQNELSVLADLTQIRNTIAHAYGNPQFLTSDKRRKLKELAKRTAGVEVGEFNFEVSQVYVASVFGVVNVCLSRFVKYLEDRYFP